MLEPREVRLADDGIHVSWSDGHQGFFPHRYLRLECPCAQCVEETTGRRIVRVRDIPEDVQALDWMQVGRYALQFLWSDAHDTGIYPFDALQSLCQCPLCARG